MKNKKFIVCILSMIFTIPTISSFVNVQSNSNMFVCAEDNDYTLLDTYYGTSNGVYGVITEKDTQNSFFVIKGNASSSYISIEYPRHEDLYGVDLAKSCYLYFDIDDDYDEFDYYYKGTKIQEDDYNKYSNNITWQGKDNAYQLNLNLIDKSQPYIDYENQKAYLHETIYTDIDQDGVNEKLINYFVDYNGQLPSNASVTNIWQIYKCCTAYPNDTTTLSQNIKKLSNGDTINLNDIVKLIVMNKTDEYNGDKYLVLVLDMPVTYEINQKEILVNEIQLQNFDEYYIDEKVEIQGRVILNDGHTEGYITDIILDDIKFLNNVTTNTSINTTTNKLNDNVSTNTNSNSSPNTADTGVIPLMVASTLLIATSMIIFKNKK